MGNCITGTNQTTVQYGLLYAVQPLIYELICCLRKNLEAFFVGIMKPSLNEKTNFHRLALFRNSII